MSKAKLCMDSYYFPCNIALTFLTFFCGKMGIYSNWITYIFNLPPSTCQVSFVAPPQSVSLQRSKSRADIISLRCLLQDKCMRLETMTTGSLGLVQSFLLPIDVDWLGQDKIQRLRGKKGFRGKGMHAFRSCPIIQSSHLDINGNFQWITALIRTQFRVILEM